MTPSTYVIHALPITLGQRVIKRLLDICIAAVCLLVAAPFLLLLALLIRLETRGTPLFRQQRVGMNGRPFTMFKLRTMVDDAVREEQRWHQMPLELVDHKKRNDPRITRIGGWLRRTSLDELPQLLNVLRGDMSLVGPRPELPWIVAQYEPWQRQRLAVPQGMTGYWQVHERSSTPLHLNCDHDLHYIAHYSLRLDLEILLQTPRAVLRGKGAF